MRPPPLSFAACAVVLIIPTQANAQLHVGDWALGLHTASNLSENPPDLVRVGFQVGYRMSKLLTLYPSAAVITDRGNWQASLHLRIDPAPGNPAMPFYLGMGGSVIEWGANTHRFYDVLLVGFEAHVGRVLPFIEVQLLDAIHRLSSGNGDFGVQGHVGISVNLTSHTSPRLGAM